MSRLGRLKSATTLGDVASLLQFKPSALSYVLFKLPTSAKYKHFDIPKRRGGFRAIVAPVDTLKLAQQKLSTLLQDCVEEINKTTGRHERAAHGFKRDRSIITNATQHRNLPYVFNSHQVGRYGRRPAPGAGDLFGIVAVPGRVYFVDDGTNTLNVRE